MKLQVVIWRSLVYVLFSPYKIAYMAGGKYARLWSAAERGTPLPDSYNSRVTYAIR